MLNYSIIIHTISEIIINHFIFFYFNNFLKRVNTRRDTIHSMIHPFFYYYYYLTILSILHWIILDINFNFLVTRIKTILNC